MIESGYFDRLGVTSLWLSPLAPNLPANGQVSKGVSLDTKDIMDIGQLPREVGRQ